jgi:dolichol-phosphate mannosyltransferase
MISSQLSSGREPDPQIDARNTVVVVPTYNEQSNVSKLIFRLFGLYPEIHLLIVDDHSPDGTAGTVRQLQEKFSNLMLLERMQDHGFAPSYRDGFCQILGEPQFQAIVTMDADFSHDPSEIRSMLDKLAVFDVVLGSRYVAGGSVENWSRWRRGLSRGANAYVHAVLGLPIHDVTSGFLCMRREALERIPFRKSASEGYAFLVELKYLLCKHGNRMAEHPIGFVERREGQSKMSLDKMWEAILLPWRIRLGTRYANAINEKNG